MEAGVLAKSQGAYYAGTGVWPLVHMRSFLAVTGPKTDLWLVKTAGAIFTCIGGQLLLSSSANDDAAMLKPLAVGCAAAVAAIEVVHVSRKRISPIYLLDAAAEMAFALLWMTSSGRRRYREG